MELSYIFHTMLCSGCHPPPLPTHLPPPLPPTFPSHSPSPTGPSPLFLPLPLKNGASPLQGLPHLAFHVHSHPCQASLPCLWAVEFCRVWLLPALFLCWARPAGRGQLLCFATEVTADNSLAFFWFLFCCFGFCVVGFACWGWKDWVFMWIDWM